MSAEDAEGRGEHFFVHEGPLRAAKNGFLIREEARRGAKNTEDHWEVSCVNARTGLILLPQIAVQPKVNEP